MNPVRYLSFNPNPDVIKNALGNNYAISPYLSPDSIENIASTLAGQEVSREELPLRIQEIDLTLNCDPRNQAQVIQNLMNALIRLGNASR